MQGKRGGADGSAPKATLGYGGQGAGEDEEVKEGETEEMARLKSLTLPHGGDWVNALLWGFTCDSRSKGRHQLKKTSVLSSSERHIFVKKIPQAITPSS